MPLILLPESDVSSRVCHDKLFIVPLGSWQAIIIVAHFILFNFKICSVETIGDCYV